MIENERVSEAQGFCKFCGKPTGQGEVCVGCTLTDLNISDAVASVAIDGKAEAIKASLLESHSGRRFDIKSPKCKIGRDPTNQVVVDEDPYASRFHAWITYEDGHFFVEDLGSTNGTLLNGSPLTRRRPIINGDKLRVGRSDFTFVVEHVPVGSPTRASKEQR